MEINRKIAPLVEEFIKRLSPDASVMVLSAKDSTLPVEVRASEANILIGQNGETLFEIQHLLKAMVNKNSSEPVFVDLDINGYKKKKTDYLRELARVGADDVSLGRVKKILAPMTAYERRVVHMELASRRDIKTESIGEGASRKIVISPC
jgi:spoIIIJ-associated protein